MSSSKIRVEENGRFQFDFSALEYVWEFHDVVAKTALSDVDFITETNEEVIFIEYKNTNIQNAANPDAMLQKLSMKRFIIKLLGSFMIAYCYFGHVMAMKKIYRLCTY